MVTAYTPELDFSTFPESDGAPMTESLENMTEMIFGMNFLMELQGRTQCAVGGNQLLYYNPRNGKDHLAPDVYVALDVPPGLRSTWKTWVEGKCPDVVMEITSGSTEDEDLGRKLRQYGELGAREYYIYDPLHKLSPPLRGYRYENQRPIPIPVTGDSITSPLLGAELRIVGMYLRVVDPRMGEPMLMTEEERRARIAAERKAAAERQARHIAEIRVDAASARAEEEVEARYVAEARVEEQAARADTRRWHAGARHRAGSDVSERTPDPPRPAGDAGTSRVSAAVGYPPHSGAVSLPSGFSRRSPRRT